MNRIVFSTDKKVNSHAKELKIQLSIFRICCLFGHNHLSLSDSVLFSILYARGTTFHRKIDFTIWHSENHIKDL